QRRSTSRSAARTPPTAAHRAAASRSPAPTGPSIAAAAEGTVVVGLSIDSHWRSLAIVSMDTIVSAKVLAAAGDPDADRELERALGWFAHVERLCSRFNPESEVFRLVSQPGQPVRVSPVVFEAIHFALEIARLSDGAFDPTIGVQQARR